MGKTKRKRKAQNQQQSSQEPWAHGPYGYGGPWFHGNTAAQYIYGDNTIPKNAKPKPSLLKPPGKSGHPYVPYKPDPEYSFLSDQKSKAQKKKQKEKTSDSEKSSMVPSTTDGTKQASQHGQSSHSQKSKKKKRKGSGHGKSSACSVSGSSNAGKQPDHKPSSKGTGLLQPVQSSQTYCSICERMVPFPACHANARHLPWFVNATSACGTCMLQFNNRLRLDRHMREVHPHENAMIPPQLWATCMNDYFKILAEAIGIDIESIPSFVRANGYANKKQGDYMDYDAVYFDEPLFRGPGPFNTTSPNSLRDCSHWQIILRLISLVKSNGGTMVDYFVKSAYPEDGYIFCDDSQASTSTETKQMKNSAPEQYSRVPTPSPPSYPYESYSTGENSHKKFPTSEPPTRISFEHTMLPPLPPPASETSSISVNHNYSLPNRRPTPEEVSNYFTSKQRGQISDYAHSVNYTFQDMPQWTYPQDLLYPDEMDTSSDDEELEQQINTLSEGLAVLSQAVLRLYKDTNN